MFSLLKFWQEVIAPSLAKNPIITGNKIDDATIQSSFEFKKFPKIVFPVDAQVSEIANYYSDLPPLKLTALERLVLQKHPEMIRIKKSKTFTNKWHFLIYNLTYDSHTNTLFLFANRVRYEVIVALGKGLFPASCPITKQMWFKVGVLVPFITDDYWIPFIERSAADHSYSAAGGFLQPLRHRKNKQSVYLNEELIKITAQKESQEEFLINNEDGSRLPFQLFNLLGMSLRHTQKIGTIDFILPAAVHCLATKLAVWITHNKAKDAYEHTKNFFFVPIGWNNTEPRRRLSISFEETQKMNKKMMTITDALQKNYPGSFLYQPMLVTANRICHSEKLPTPLPNRNLSIMMLSATSPQPSLTPITYSSNQPSQDKEKTFNKFLNP